jgi:acetyltransferase-like isoleucine patch superfamily enzyme
MVMRPLRALPPTPAAPLGDAWLAQLRDRLTATGADRAAVCRDTLCDLAFPQYASNWETAVADEKLPLGTRLALASLDPRNITLEPEYYADCDQDKFRVNKPLLWLWYSFDRLPIGGQAIELGLKLRRLLAPMIFRKCGERFKCFQHVEFSYGYNLEVGDDCVIHRHVLLDDRGGLVLGNRVSVSDYANVYSHTHSIVDQKDVTNAVTTLEDDVRITYHATVLAGTRVGTNAMVGAVAVATKDVRPYHVNVGIPAKSIRVKPNAPQARDRLLDSDENK